ncbi:MAG TPA: hypothetical protein VHB25_21395 [Gemmatimonadaceae bacterium]|nr:hypothetical protein [Gemmatimonadaceae bacterium]
MNTTELEQVLDRLIRDVEASVHAFYRGDVRQHTQRIRTDSFRNTARDALLPHIGNGAAASSGAAAVASADPSPAGSALSADEIVAATRCIMAWLPMGAPATASPQSRCVPAAREMTPTWGEREKARNALKRLQS